MRDAALLVNLPPVGDPGDGDEFRLIIDEINYASVTDSHAPLVPVASQLLASCGSGIVGQCRDLAVYPREHGFVQRVQLSLRRVLDFERVLSHGGVRVSGGPR